jgi:hypothetical protein
MEGKRKKRPFINVFGVTIMILALLRYAFPGLAISDKSKVITEKPPLVCDVEEALPSVVSLVDEQPHSILSVPSYDECFPDSNHVQLEAARRWGVAPVANRKEAELRKNDLVYVGCSPFYQVATLHQSIAYLVPRAAILLQDIGQAFYDSLHVKGLPFQKFIVTSVMRTKDDVARLRKCNRNATDNSCHLYGTTFDIGYTHYATIDVPGQMQQRAVRDDTLKFILSEVLNDARLNGRCYVKYEKRQKCFHITVR